MDLLEPVRKKPLSIRQLSLNPGALSHAKIDYAPTPAFPREVLACTNIESLDLFRTIAWDGNNAIPEEIGNLVKLRELTLGGLAMKALPDSIGNLRALRVLSLDYASELTKLPKTIGKLSSLEALSLSYAEKLRELPKEIGRLGKLRVLDLSDTRVKSVPRELFDLKELRLLRLPETVKALPPGISKLAKLEELTISAAALESRANELPKLRALSSLSLHQGARAKLPEEVGALPKLVSLRAAYAGLSALPASLTGHRTIAELDVAGNKLTELESLVVSLPKLTELDFSDNPLDRAQKRRIDALMKLPPSKRRANAPLPPKGKAPKVTEIGCVSSLNASNVMIIGDARAIAKWKRDAYDALCDALADADFAKTKAAGVPVLGLTLAVGQGVVHVMRAGDAILAVEGFLENWKDASFLEDIAHPPEKGAKPVARIPVTSGKLSLSWSACQKGDDDASIVTVTTKPGDYDVFVEDEKKASWGSARRAIFMRR